jgi:Four helix bundle sensory module for signal transduction
VPAIILGDVVPMLLTLSSPPATRLRQLLVLLLLALGLLAGVSVSQSRDAEAQAIHTEAVLLPTLQQVHDLASRVDEQRGMAALHITLRSDTERQVLDGRLRASRQQVERRMAALGQRPAGDTDRQHHATVQSALTSFWAAQDKLLAASRRATQDPAAADLARSLLAGEAQQAFDHLRADIEAWWAEIERAAAQLASQSRAAAQHAALVVWALALLAALALAVGWALLRLPLQAQQPSQAPQASAGVPDSHAAQQHLLALNEVVAAARRGEPGRAPGLSSMEAQRLAEQVDGAARGLRRLIDRPAAAPNDRADRPDRPDSPPPAG